MVFQGRLEVDDADGIELGTRCRLRDDGHRGASVDRDGAKL